MISSRSFAIIDIISLTALIAVVFAIPQYLQYTDLLLGTGLWLIAIHQLLILLCFYFVLRLFSIRKPSIVLLILALPVIAVFPRLAVAIEYSATGNIRYSQAIGDATGVANVLSPAYYKMNELCGYNFSAVDLNHP